MTTINSNILTDNLLNNKTLQITTTNEKDNITSNLKNTVKLQLAIAYLFHNKDTKLTGKMEIDVDAGTINDGRTTYTIDDNVLTANFPICNSYQTLTTNSALSKTTFAADGNFYDGFFSMFDGTTPTQQKPSKKTTKSKRGGGKKH